VNNEPKEPETGNYKPETKTITSNPQVTPHRLADAFDQGREQRMRSAAAMTGGKIFQLYGIAAKDVVQIGVEYAYMDGEGLTVVGYGSHTAVLPPLEENFGGKNSWHIKLVFGHRSGCKNNSLSLSLNR
jgi:hypothetical protein